MRGLGHVEPGAVVFLKGCVFTVVSAKPVDESCTSPSWPDGWRRDAVKVELRDHADDATWDGVLPRRPSFHDGTVRVLASPDDEGHFPSCPKCGEPWPCSEVENIWTAGRQADAVLSQIEHEAEHPWPCTWCGRFTVRLRPRRFKTERGMKQHLRRCRDNPDTWDASRWLHFFSDDLKIRGGVSPVYLMNHPDEQGASPHAAIGVRFGSLDELVAINVAVKDAALDGRLPARLADLDVT